MSQRLGSVGRPFDGHTVRLLRAHPLIGQCMVIGPAQIAGHLPTEVHLFGLPRQIA
ncbi:hypothetical protein BJY24_006541 [Nocardia transvalensis]|uniref:Uncharacterized protein n=1 Tax=Nocardia transvalensis TaxID=37333 RepID=A0A7W9ULK3_9NOCA|nr:hypothetical protein [Nocardia transvalensis]MBB5917629.1 hypothetical protein [Nocardia transvalensis]